MYRLSDTQSIDVSLCSESLKNHGLEFFKSKASVIMLPQKVVINLQKGYAKQKHPVCKKGVRPKRCEANKKQPYLCATISAEAKKSPIKDALNYLNDIATIIYSIFSQV